MFVLHDNNSHYWIFSTLTTSIPPFPATPGNEGMREVIEAVHYILDIRHRGYYPPSPNVKFGLSKIICEALRFNRVDVVRSIDEFEDIILDNDELYTECAFESGAVEPVQLMVNVLGFYGLDYIQNYIMYNRVNWDIIDYLHDRIDVDVVKHDLKYLIDSGTANSYQTELYDYLNQMDITSQFREFNL